MRNFIPTVHTEVLPNPTPALNPEDFVLDPEGEGKPEVFELLKYSA